MGTYCELHSSEAPEAPVVEQLFPKSYIKSGFDESNSHFPSSKRINKVPQNFYQIEMQLCEPNPCLNNGACKIINENNKIRVKCHCSGLFSGKLI